MLKRPTPATVPLGFTVPPGFMADSAGRLVPIETVRPVDIERDKLVLEIVEKAKILSAAISTFKGAVFGDIEAFVELSAEQYGVQLRGAAGKGNVSLASFDGRYKVQRAVAESISFDERLIAAKALIDECITDWSAGSRPEIHALINNAFQVDKAGKINTGRDSPVSNNGRGLKQPVLVFRATSPFDSPVSNNGRGLKHQFTIAMRAAVVAIRPLAITGVD